MASANCKSPRNEKVCADNGLPFCLPLPPTGTDVHPLLLLPLLLCPFLRPVLLPLMPLAPAPVDVPGPVAHHQQHHHSCLRCRLQPLIITSTTTLLLSPASSTTIYSLRNHYHHLMCHKFLLCSPSLYFNSNRIIIIMASYIKGSEYQTIKVR